MIDRRWRKVARDLWRHRARTVLVILAMAMGLAGSGAILNAWALIRRVTAREFLASRPASATLHTDSVDTDLLAAVRGVPGVRDAQARRTTAVTFRSRAGTQSGLLFTADDLSDVRIGRLAPDRGAWPPAEGELAIERSSFEFSGAAVGEPVLLGPEGEPGTPVTVTGIVRDVGLAPGWMERVVYGFVTRGTLARLGLPSALTEVQILVDPRLDRDGVRRIAHAARTAVEERGRRVWQTDVPEPGTHIHAGQMNSLLYTQAAFGVLALLSAALLVLNLVTAMLAGQVREIGVMKAIGARPAQIGAMYLVLAGALGLAASALALPVAAVAGRSYAGMKAELLNFPIAGHATPWWAYALLAVAGLLIPVAAAALPVRRACRMSVGAALRDVGLAAARPGGGPAYRVHGLRRPLLLSIRNAFRRRQRMTLTLLALTTGGALFIGALNLRRGMLGAVDLLFAPFHYDITVRVGAADTPQRLEAALGGVAGVATAEAWGRARAERMRPDGTPADPFTLAAPPGGSRLLTPSPTAGRWLTSGDSAALVVSRGLVEDDSGLTPGTEVALLIEGEAVQWRVVGVIGSPMRVAYTTRDALARARGTAATDMAVLVASGAGPAAELALIGRLRAELPRAGIEVRSTQRVAESRRAMEEHQVMVVNFLAVMAWVMVAIGGLGLASTMSLAVLERTREIGVLRAVGARHGALHALIQVEGLVVALLSWVLAIPLSVPVSVGLGLMFGRIFLRVPVELVPTAFATLGWLVVVTVVSVAASAWPAIRATRVSPAEALTYE